MLPSKRWAPIERRPPSAAPPTRPSSGPWPRPGPPRRPAGAEVVVAHNYDDVAAIIAERVERTDGRISAKRLLPVVRAAGYEGSARNLRRAVAEAKAKWRVDHHRGRRPGVWAPGDVLVFDWGEIGPLFVFCAVLAWSRFRFVYFADNLGAQSTMAALAECMETIGGGAQNPPHRSHGLSEGRQRGRARGPDTGLRALRHPLRHPPGLL